MKMNFTWKKAACLVLSIVIVLSLAACGSAKTEESSSTGLTEDALRNVTADELTQKTGITLTPPEGATDVTYNVLLASTEHPIAEMCFTLNGVEAYERAQSTSMTSLLGGDEADPDAAIAALDSEEYNISGLNYEWTEAGSNTVEKDSCEAVVKTCDEAGYVAWLDVVPGILYNVGVVGQTDTDSLMELANAVFVPMQGDA